jgi:UDP-N-acetylmuramoylalanine--D-glutamate ligase
MRHLVANVIAKLIYFGTKPYQGNGFLLDGEWISYRREGKVIPMVQKSKIPLKGNHNLENVMAALAVSLIRMLDPGKVVDALCSFQAPEHRLEWCGNLQGIDVYNDSKATNIDACVKAVEAFDSPVVLIMGGRNKGMDFSQLCSSLAGRVKKILAIGESAVEIQEVLGGSIPVEICASMPSAVEQGLLIGTPGAVLLLAPACASYDMFTDYKERGRIFKEEVAKRKGVIESAS